MPEIRCWQISNSQVWFLTPSNTDQAARDQARMEPEDSFGMTMSMYCSTLFSDVVFIFTAHEVGSTRDANSLKYSSNSWEKEWSSHKQKAGAVC